MVLDGDWYKYELAEAMEWIFQQYEIDSFAAA
jgi:hypothetical protein